MSPSFVTCDDRLRTSGVVSMSDWDTFKEYNAIADSLIDGASKEQLAETARILALNIAHFKAQFGEAPTTDLGAILEAGKVDDAAAGTARKQYGAVRRRTCDRYGTRSAR